MTVIPLNHTVESPTPEEKKSGESEIPAILLAATQEALNSELGYAGTVNPEDAWKLFVGGQAHLIDVRTSEERKFVGHVPNTLHIAWQTGPALIKNPRFLRELENKLPRDAAILLLCRSGKRSAAAAIAATKAGFTRVYNVCEGFEGDLDDNQQRGRISGWRQRGLPWVQD
ncbi:rhodanese-like domain-containing protein [Cellvibrio japonicus]|uniref:Rhodanese-like domain protein n=1 Tax=Cellvibrio japonicus (strain Ueda107) TaxID=498211 RepID=B3PJC6_CELJU|nr:rhodanese-like domain-containing protein [Cellvibrio japonicus]ACE85145.1 Rhodanese-like domain protein [Cellvibrio japonicus Ueda107]QEI12672.1 rhodanese-like domain-containing protein [Cellvibrio japonicus]QEI16246.1 rhodanese-like domain-containing protein [Cellvibrio japonicus]QEI19824.1 rhodanese-like domain-containing protein [Cellvibrio japonicus]